MKIFLIGISCVGKTTIGRVLAGRLGYRFIDMDEEIERHFHCSLERLQGRFLTDYSFRKTASIVLRMIGGEKENLVVALPPSGLRDAYLAVLKKVDRAVVVVIADSPENIVNRLVFYDIDSQPIEKRLTDKERRLYVREIKKDITYYRKSYDRATLKVDISGLGAEDSAAKIDLAIKNFNAKATL